MADSTCIPSTLANDKGYALVYEIKLLLAALLVMMIAAFAARPAFRDLVPVQGYKNAWKVVALATAVSFLGRYPLAFLFGVAVTGVIAFHLLGKDIKARIAAFLLLMLVFPPISQSLGGVGDINHLLTMDHMRALSLVLLFPGAIQLIARKRNLPARNPFLVIDLLLLAYHLYILGQVVPSTSGTGLVRIVTEKLIDVLLPYYVMTRGLQSIADVRFVVLHFTIGCVYLGSIAVVECLLQRNFYTPLQYIYGVTWQLTHTLMRGGYLRVQATTPEPIALAFLMITGLAMFTWLTGKSWRRLSSLSVYAVLLVALASTWSRGPWLGAGIFLLSLIALRWVSARTYSFGLISLLLAGVIVKLFGADELIYDFLRSLFGSTEDDFGSIQYRRQLLDAALALIKQSPTFGVPNFGAYLQEFRQGEGIIDLVNTYLMVTLSSGMVGLVLYALPPLIVIMSLLRRLAPPVANSAPDLFVCVFVSVQIAIAFTLITTSTIYVMPYVLLFLMAMPLVYVRILADGMNEQPIAVSAAGPLTLARRNR